MNDTKLSEAEYREAEAAKAYAHRPYDACEVIWGHCDERNPTYFGKPTTTPHVCKGGRKHGSKLHACEKCGCVGAVHQPLAFTKAGKQLRALVLAEARHQALQKARIYLESKVREAEAQ